MFKQVFASALFAGLIAGACASALQNSFIEPIILEAEMYETGVVEHFARAGDHDHGGAEAAAVQSDRKSGHDQSAPPARDQVGGPVPESLTLERAFLTTLATIITMTGFSLLMVVGFAVAERRGIALIDGRVGALWGLALFAAVHLATGAGLAPELPGSIAAEIQPRQIWWLGTAFASLAGIGLIAYAESWTLKVAGAALLAAPHLIGAPLPEVYGGSAPPELAAIFVSRTMAVGAISLMLLGSLAGMMWKKEGRSA